MSNSVSYSLYLSSVATAPYQTSNSDLANVKYNINWDSFFNGDNYRYKKCRITYQYLSDPTSSATYSYDPLNFSGVIVAAGLTTTNGSPYGGVVLGIVDVKTIPYITAGTAVNNQTVLYSDYLQQPGQNISIPQGQRELAIQLWSNFASNGAKLLSAVSPVNIPFTNWILNMVFELYDPIDEM